MEDKTKQIFLVSFAIFALLIWHNYNQPTFHDSVVNQEYRTYMNKKVDRILGNKQTPLIKEGRFLSSEPANCLGCCRKRGGVTCLNGKTVCKKDKSHLSFTCRNNGCNACPVLKSKR
ncbi:MAG: hypothetical protein OEY33_03795 [Bdellovibrionales bacterium]|nr:hypothetical protein [Bdellovibrionales bacterium]